MTLRLVLISLVAGLGIGLPSWPTVEGWVAGAQKWMNARLAAADDRAGERRVIIHDLLAAEMQRAHAARQAHRAAATPPPASRPAVIAVPHWTAPRRLAAAALAAPSIPLPKLDDYLAAAAIAPAPAIAPAAPSPSAVRPDDLLLMAWERARPEGARLAAALAEGLREAADRDRDARAFVAMEESADLYFDGHEDDVAVAVVDAPAEPTPLPAEAVAVEGPEPVALEGPLPVAVVPAPAPTSDFDEMERSADLYFASPIVEEPASAPEAMLAETPEAAPAPEAVAMAELPDDVFAPDATEPVAVAVVAEEPAAPSPEVNRAVRLTREALSAWVNVLTGPALVTAAHGGAITR